jgi:uncharacterized protein
VTLPAGYPVTAPALRGPALMDQYWNDLAFVHWPVDPGSVAQLFPAGTRPDVWEDGFTYVALVPFAMRGAGFGRSRPVPYFGSFLETNIRLYSVDDAGRHGVLFRSLETARLAIVPFARGAFGIPYTWARMSLSVVGDLVTYESVRRWPRRGLHSRLSLRIGAETTATPLETFLTARWGAHSRVAGRTVWVPNEHGPWPLRSAEALQLDDDLLDASGVRAAGPPLRVLWSSGVRTQFGRPSLVH